MIGIYYISTGEYTQFYDGFINSLRYWWPDEEKIVMWLTDDKTMEPTDNPDNKIKVIKKYITHFPWPVITLYKPYLIYTNKIEGCKGHFYFNANCLFQERCKTFDYSFFDDQNLVFCSKVDRKDEPQINFFYLQGGIFYIPESRFNFLKVWQNNIDTFINRYKRVPEFHDETVLNTMTSIPSSIKDFKIFHDKEGNYFWGYYDHSVRQDGYIYIRDSHSINIKKNDCARDKWIK